MTGRRGTRLDAAHRRTTRVGIRPWLYWPVRALLVPIVSLLLRPVRVGSERIPASGPVIVAANHRSMLDPFVIGLMTRRKMYFVGKAELFQNRLLGWLLGSLGVFPVRRGSGDSQMVDTALAILERGDCVMIFPEGTRSRGAALGRPKRGLGKLALESGAAVVPVALAGSGEGERRRWRARRVFVSVARPARLSEITADVERPDQAILERVWSEVERRWRFLSTLMETGRNRMPR